MKQTGRKKRTPLVMLRPIYERFRWYCQAKLAEFNKNQVSVLETIIVYNSRV